MKLRRAGMNYLAELITREKFVIEHGHHNRDSVIIVLEGKFECTIGNRHFFAEKDDICAFYKETVFDRKVLCPLKCIYIQFPAFPVGLTSGILDTFDPTRAGNTIHHLKHAIETGNAELTAHFIRDLFLLYEYSVHPDVISDPTVSACISYFRQNVSERITLDLLCSRFSLTKQGLIKKFRKHTGKTPMEYLAQIRLSHGKTLLKDTGLPVSEIAEACGFENVYYFSNFFKSKTGLSPSSYRASLNL